ncbi:MAG: hypothetical protein EZS28_027738 [Streblomastix strix]|uniref:Uncharacterized protein n=1 Tax=Streblomastix strix TaxID=222440 RepID=A0A5J4V2L1_9EUKA|nr:MAG: hypothetical protein EZS28_027738 [Streblomastix strix]
MTILNKQEIRKESRRRSAIFVITVDLDHYLHISWNNVQHHDQTFKLHYSFEQSVCDYCHPKLKLGEAIIWIILMQLAIVFLFVIRIFSYEFLMHTKFIIASRDWILNGWLLVVQNIWTVIETMLVEECRLGSALLNIGVHCLYCEYVILKSPMKRIGGNELGGVYLWVVGCGGIASVIVTALNALS